MASKRLDLFGKNLVGEVLDLRGNATVEVEIPPTDSLRIDLWFVPDTVKQQVAPRFSGPLAEIDKRPNAIELWSDVVDEREFQDSYYKRHAWVRALEMRNKRVWPQPGLWHFSAGRPNKVIVRFGFEPVVGSSGWYKTRDRGWDVDLVVIGELLKTRETVLLRLLGSKAVRLEAIRDLDALPEDAWEKALARGWLDRLELRVRDPGLPPSTEEKEFLMNLLEQGRERMRRDRAQLEFEVRRDVELQIKRELESQIKRELEPQIKRELEPQIKRELEPQIKRELEPQIKRELLHEAEEQLLRERAHPFERRLGRTLSATELGALANRVRELGPERVMDVALDYAPTDLAAWLDV